MKKYLVIAAVLAALIFVTPFLYFADAAPGCDARAAQPWVTGRGVAHHVEAFSNGPTCAHAVVTIIVRAPNGMPLLSDSMPAAQVMIFAGLKARSEVKAALKDWMTQTHLFKSSSDLPVWKKGEAAPSSGEFAFYPDESVDRDFYEQVRAAKVPVFCYVQGMESLACTVLKDGGMSKIGLQTFPG